MAQDTSPLSRDYLKSGDIIRLLPISRNTILAMVKRGELPAPDISLRTMNLWHKDRIMPAIRAILGTEVEL
ncbi:hypothetical protein ABFB50_07915 [Dehalococcoides sp. THU3]|uniref:hypothetical protein n=1 Tax=Dehalococcoides sp. THU3 TaxID=3151601 RepID=UPI0032188D66